MERRAAMLKATIATTAITLAIVSRDGFMAPPYVGGSIWTWGHTRKASTAKCSGGATIGGSRGDPDDAEAASRSVDPPLRQAPEPHQPEGRPRRDHGRSRDDREHPRDPGERPPRIANGPCAGRAWKDMAQQ